MRSKNESQLPASTINPMMEAFDEEVIIEEQQPKRSRWTKVGGLLLVGVAVAFGFAGLLYSSSETESTSDAGEAHNNPPVGEFAPPVSRNALPRTTFVHLFEWKWSDIEKECVNFLGPAGFAAVQVSPANEHINHKALDNNPWWTRYQPVSYKLDSRSGSREEFISMVQTCKSVGVDIYVDAVLNHMAAIGTGVGNAGSSFDPVTRTYPIYSGADFNYCDPPDIQGSDYSNNPYRVRHCQLVGLPDLNQELDYVRDVEAAFLQDMVDIGVAGFRLDAGKHMEPHDVNEVLRRLNGDFYIFSEVIDFGYDAVSQAEYTPFYDVTEFRYEKTLGNTFANGRLADLYGIGESFGFMNGLSAVVFVDNHDTQRHYGAPLTYKSGGVYNLANTFLLAWPYGYPKVMSSYAFDNFDNGPPAINGDTKDIYNSDGSMNCFGEWVCEHRYREIYQMVRFKNYVASEGAYGVEHWWTNGFQAIAFARTGSNGSAGFVIINKEDFQVSQSWYTGLPDGTYCDVYTAEYNPETGVCTGNTVSVSGGFLQTSVNGKSALAIYAGARV